MLVVDVSGVRKGDYSISINKKYIGGRGYGKPGRGV